MKDYRSQLLPLLQARRLPGIELSTGQMIPAYDGFSLVNLPASVCGWLDVPALGASPLDGAIRQQLSPRYRHVILILADGLGLNLLEPELDSSRSPLRPHLENALLAPLTSIAPSTTVAALTSLWTGVPVVRHAMTGYEMWLKEYSMSINAITHAPFAFTADPGGLRRAGFDTTTFLTVPTLGPHLVENGVRPFAYHHASIFRSSLSTMLLPGVKSIPYRTQADLWVTLADVLGAQSAERSYHYVYWGDLDELMHRYGPGDLRVTMELEQFLIGVSGFLTHTRQPDTLVLLLADHGQVHTPQQPQFDLRNHPDLTREMVILPSGEHRFAYLFPREGSSQQIQNILQRELPGKFSLIPAITAVESGLFGAGEPHPRLRDRVGDWIAVANETTDYLWWTNQENRLLGRHGGLSAEEMLIPLLAIELPG